MHEQDHLDRVYAEFQVNPRKISRTRNRRRHRSQRRMVDSLNQSSRLAQEKSGEFRTMIQNLHSSNYEVTSLKSGGTRQSPRQTSSSPQASQLSPPVKPFSPNPLLSSLTFFSATASSNPRPFSPLNTTSITEFLIKSPRQSVQLDKLKAARRLRVQQEEQDSSFLTNRLHRFGIIAGREGVDRVQ